MKLKICGMVYPENIKAISKLNPDYLGFIFYEKSKRFASGKLDPEQLKNLPESIKKIGVFVNSGLDDLIRIFSTYNLDLVQLHGDEAPEFCKMAADKGIKIIKAFAVGGDFDFNILEPYKSSCDYFLFDTKGNEYGGTGQTFKWEILNNFDNSKPFFLSGGIDLENIKELEKYRHLNIHSIDINSKFEISPGLKDIDKVMKLIDYLNFFNKKILKS